MEQKDLIQYCFEEVLQKRNVEIEYKINDIPYKIKILYPDELSGINFPRIIAIPLSRKMNNRIVFESNNLETDNLQEQLIQGTQTAFRLAMLTKEYPAPIVVPLLPSYKDGPYFQQLSKECFELSAEDKNYRIDEQIIRTIADAKKIIEEETSVIIDNKIFLNGYSSSGVFAQRFALLHPELINTLCVGGASGSIPLPTMKIGYPIGIEDYRELFGKNFDTESYKKIAFKYYVGELETENKTTSRYDDNNNPAPMHDMSYFNRSVPTKVGKIQRELLGRDMFERAQRTVEMLNDSGFNIKHTIFPGRTHSNKNGKGVNELGDKFINDAYRETSNNTNSSQNTSKI